MPSTQRFIRYLGVAVRERRESLPRNKSQEEIAHRAHITVRHLQKIEAGQTNPKLETLLAVAKGLKTSLQTLLDRAKELEKRR